MLGVVNFKAASCSNCYTCVRHCEVKAIRVKNRQVQIMRDMCVYCGQCLEICPEGAQTFDSDIPRVKEMLKGDNKVVVSLDPSYRGLLHVSQPGQFVEALNMMGFADVRETAEGAEIITREYVRLIEEGQMKNIITSSCPAAMYLVEKHYPMLKDFLAPVISPMIAHGKLIKEMYGADTKVVFIGSCLAKKIEGMSDYRTAGYIDAVIEFSELENWMHEIGIRLEECGEQPFSNEDPMINQMYAVADGIIKAVNTYGASLEKYKRINVSGIKNCRELLHSMKCGEIDNCFVEMSICEGGCINGPGMAKHRGFRFKAAMNIDNTAKIQKPPVRYDLPPDELKREYEDKHIEEIMPSEEEIKEILKTIGKRDSDTEFNCGACGYMNCREKAIAIYQGKAESHMCLIRSYEDQRSLESVVLEHIPNIVFIIDKDYRIKEFNKKAEETFFIKRSEALKKYLFDFVDPEDYEEVYETHENKLHIKQRWDHYDMIVMTNIIYIESTDRVLAVIEDITEEERRAEKHLDRQAKVINLAQTVTEKQMVTAQEIAGLLGETTAETKAILSKIMGSMMDDEEEDGR